MYMETENTYVLIQRIIEENIFFNTDIDKKRTEMKIDKSEQNLKY